MRTLLVDADVIAFKIASVIEKVCVDDEGYIHYWWADAGEGRDKVDSLKQIEYEGPNIKPSFKVRNYEKTDFDCTFHYSIFSVIFSWNRYS